MSDVSGIPYMGPMGQGNFFAPSFSYNPQMSAGQIQSNYMPQYAQGQDVLHNLYASGGGFGQQTNYYSQLAANQLSGLTPHTFDLSNAGSGMSWSDWDRMGRPSSVGGNYQTPTGMPTLDLSGGSMGNSFFSNFTGGGLSFPTPQITSPYTSGLDWSRIGEAAGSLYPSRGSSGLSGFGSDINPFAGLSHQPQLDWSGMSGGALGGAKTDPAPGMAMPGGLNSPMTAPQQPAIDWTQPSGTTRTDPAPGMTMPGGLNSPMTTQQPPADFSSRFGDWSTSPFDTGAPSLVGADNTSRYNVAGGTGGLGWGEATGQTYTPAAEPQRGMLGPQQITEAYNPYFGVTSPYDQRSGGDVVGPGGGLSATDLSAQARARLAELMKPEEKAATSPPSNRFSDELYGTSTEPPVFGEGERVPLPQARPEGADAPRPPEAIPATGKLFPARPEGPAREEANPPRPPANIPLSGPTLKGVNPRLVAAVEGGASFLPPGYRIELVSGKEPRAFGYHPGGSAIDVRIIGPDGAIPHKGEDTTGMYTLLARGVKTWVQQNDPATASQLGYGGAFGTRGGKPGEVPDLMHYDLGGSRGQMRPGVQFGVLQPLSEAEKNAMPAYIPLLGDNQVPLDGRVPSGAGTRAPVAPMRFGGDFGGAGGELPSSGAFTPYEGFRQSPDFENRTAEQLGRDELATLQTRDTSYEPGPEVAPTPLSSALGLGDLPMPASVAQAAGSLAPDSGGAPAPQGTPYWDIPKEGTPRWNAEVYEPFVGSTIMRRPENQTIGGASQYDAFRRSGDVEDRRNEVIGRDQLAALKALTKGYYTTGPEPAGTASNSLSTALGLGNLPVPTNATSTGMARPQGIADEQFGSEAASLADRFGEWPTQPSDRYSDVTGAQQGPTQPGWQSSLNRDFMRPELQQYSMPDTVAALERLTQRHGIPPEAVINIAGVEGSRWNPRYHSLGSSGIFQMDPPDFQEDGRSRPLGGLTFEQYRDTATPAQQVDAYSDYIANSRNYPALDYAAGSNDPALYSALLQGMQFSPMRTTWAEQLAEGNTSFPTHYNPPRAAAELRPTSIDAMREAFARRIAAFPQSGTLPGGR